MARANSTTLNREERSQVSRALAILKRKLESKPFNLSSPSAVRKYLKLKLAAEPVEVFYAIWLDAQNRVIAFEKLFSGTLTQTAVYPREVLKSALRRNAASVIFAHNHPSGCSEPSRADVHLTMTLKTALSLVDIRVLDHFVIGCTDATSLAERGEC